VLESADLEVEAGSKKEAKALAKTKVEAYFDCDDWMEVYVAGIEVLGPSEGEPTLAFPNEAPEEKLDRWNKMAASANIAAKGKAC